MIESAVRKVVQKADWWGLKGEKEEENDGRKSEERAEGGSGSSLTPFTNKISKESLREGLFELMTCIK